MKSVLGGEANFVINDEWSSALIIESVKLFNRPIEIYTWLIIYSEIKNNLRLIYDVSKREKKKAATCF